MRKTIWLSKGLSYFMLILMGSAVVSMIGLPWIVSSYLDYVEYWTNNTSIRYFFLVTLYLCGALAMVILYELKVIFKSCTTQTPFEERNVKALKRIGHCAAAIGIAFAIKAVFFFTILTIIVVFVFALASLFCYVLADVFGEAIRFKRENDLTI